MTRIGPVVARSLAIVSLAWLSVAMPSRAAAQGATAPAQANADAGKPFFIGGFLSTSFLGDCTDCEGAQYRSTGSFLAGVGWALNPRADLGVEILRVFSESPTATDRVRVTFLLGSVQFRPWRTRGFFLKGGAGMAVVHNWFLSLDGADASFRSRAFALDLAAGWEWRLSRHFAVQALGAHHVAAVGDLESSERTLENVMGNFWSVGGAVVIR